MSNSSFEVLLIGDQPKCLRLLRKQPFEVVCAGRLADGLAQLKTRRIGLVLMALSLPDGRGTKAFVKVHEAAHHVPIIVLAARAEEKVAASLMPLGAQDYLFVPELTGPMLDKAIHNAIERHMIREEHSRAGHLLQVLMDNIPDAIYFKDAASRFVTINRSHAKKFGLADPHLAVGKSDTDFFTSAHAQQALADEQRIMQTGQPLVGVEEKETWPDGSITWVSTTKMPLRDRAGRIFGTFGISRDITEHRRVEQALAERTAELLKERRLLRTLIDNLPDCIYTKDTAGRKTMANPADLKNLRCKTEAEAIGKSDFDLFPPDIAEKFWADDQKVIQGEPVLNREEYFIDEEGRKRWLLTSKLPLRDQNGKIVGLVGIGHDITKRKQVELALAERTEEVFQRNLELAGTNTTLQQQIAERERIEQALNRERLLLRTLIDNLPDAIYAKDTAGRKTMANPADLKNLRCKTEAEAIGKSDFDLFPKEIAEQFWADDQSVIQGQPVINREEYFTDEAGQQRWLLTSKLPLRDQSGKIVGLIGIGHDITKRKQVELALAERTEQLERKNKQTVEELKMARELQLAMLPHEFPCVPRHKPREESDLEFFSFFFPAGAVSGDFFDVIPLSDTAVGLFICDVMGHDVRAALVTAMMRALVVDLSTTTEPGELLTQINREVSGVFKQSGSTMYATAFYLIADVAHAELRYASAAHPEPILLHRQRGTAEWLGHSPGQKKGPALGLFAEGQFPTCRCPMEVGDLIALFTDGLIEAEGADNESFSPERLLAAVRQRVKLPTNELFTGLLDEIKQFSASSEFEDDVCIVGVEVKRLEAEQPNWMV
jgi:sigma-B regulation protein RsbU (phosphoserine phosphatase)